MPEVLAIASLFLFALAPAAVGLWQPGEPAAVGLLAFGAGAAGLLARPIPRPLWPLLAIVGLTTIAMLFHPFPMRSWLGTPELGIGAGWFAAWGLLAALLLAVDRVQLGPCVLLAGLAILVVHLLAPGYFLVSPQWMAFVGLAVAAEGSAIAGALGLALVLASSSKGAVAVAACLPLVWVAASVVPRPALRVGLVLGLVTAITLAVFLIPAPSLASRALLLRGLWDGLGADPWLLVTGIGWGGYNDLLLGALPGLEALDPTWEGRGGGAFHSHSMYGEALAALGVPGLVAMLAVVAVPAWWCEDPLALACWCGIAGLMCLWFPLPMAVPFLAWALARTIGRVP